MFLVFFAYQRFLASCILVNYFPKLLIGSLQELQHHLVFYHESQPGCVERSSFAANEVSRVASCLLSSSNLLAEVAFVVGRGSQGVVEKYAGAFGNTDGTASFFKYLRHSSLSPGCFCRDEFLSWLYSTKSLSLKCREQRPELVVG